MVLKVFLLFLIFCSWGGNVFGQVGDGTNTNRNTPLTTDTLSSVTMVATGKYHTCALVSGGIKCWGQNNAGQLGTGATSAIVRSPPASASLSGLSLVACGDSFTCVVAATDGSVKCFGLGNYGKDCLNC